MAIPTAACPSRIITRSSTPTATRASASSRCWRGWTRLSQFEITQKGRLRPFSVSLRGCVLARPALPAAVDPQHLAGNEGAHGACEKFDNARDLVDRRDPVERAGLDHSVGVDCARSEEAAGAGISGRDAVDGDIVGTELVGQASRV